MKVFEEGDASAQLDVAKKLIKHFFPKYVYSLESLRAYVRQTNWYQALRSEGERKTRMAEYEKAVKTERLLDLLERIVGCQTNEGSYDFVITLGTQFGDVILRGGGDPLVVQLFASANLLGYKLKETSKEPLHKPVA